jgi:hypothetical protein
VTLAHPARHQGITIQEIRERNNDKKGTTCKKALQLAASFGSDTRPSCKRRKQHTFEQLISIMLLQ